MTTDAGWVYGLLLVFVRSSAMFLSSPLFGGSVPGRVRVAFCFMFSICVLPVVQASIGAPPDDMFSLVAAIAREAGIGLLIGLCTQLLLVAAQMAGGIMDMQLGFQMMQMFNPQLGGMTSLLGQFKFLLFLVLIFLMNGHHMMLTAFVRSFESPIVFDTSNLATIQSGLIQMLGGACVLAIQIAAPVAAVSFIVDAASGVINKSIPQMPVSMVTLGAKSALGTLSLALGLPLMVVAVQSGLGHTSVELAALLRIGQR
ncbi:MAG: flagellar biosynthetic protein FliR [Chthonomonas sp.]|nr:flagellar biosynthetic protein FliR [Chthonomonas sp.]